MDNLARPDLTSDFGTAFLGYVRENSSVPITAPLSKFLQSSQNPSGLRSAAQEARPALIADIAHFMCVSHGLHPGVVDHAATKILDDSARRWLVDAINAFAAERNFLNNLTVAAGPLRSRSGQEKVSALLSTQSKNFQMLATSDRRGCAAGAAIAFILDWVETRPLLVQVAYNLGIDAMRIDFPSESECQQLAGILGADTAASRAMMFGAEQLLGQQRGLWRVIAARHSAMLG
jgi:hypothetical protein